MTGFKVPLDAMVVAVPTAYALMCLGGLVVKTLATDPEMTNLDFYDKPESSARGAAFNNQIRGLFTDRIKQHKFGLFNNDYQVPK